MAPLLSVIVPVYNVDRYLPQCLSSVLDQAFTDIEVIAVDGASTDRSPEILQKRAAEDPRLRVVRDETKIGPGAARNIGAERATGEYLWFVDGDDAAAAGSLDVIASRISDTRPDVLLMGWESCYPDGRREPGFGLDLLRRARGECFTVGEEPWIIDLTMASWAKVVRREFLGSTGAAFARDAPHEDVPVSCLVLLNAGRVAVAPEVCYHYRRNRPGSLMTQTPAHFNIFQSYRCVLEQVEKLAGAGEHGVPAHVHKAFFERAIWHYSTIFDAGGVTGAGALLPGDSRREFFDNMHWDFVRHRPAGYRCGSGKRGLKFRLIERNAYHEYELLLPANKLLLLPANKLRVAAARAVGRIRGAGPPGA